MEKYDGFEKVDSKGLIHILQNDYDLFGSDLDINNKYLKFETYILEKRKNILKVLLDRLEK